MKKLAFSILCLIAIFSIGIYFHQTGEPAAQAKDDTLNLKELTKTQSGLGTIMIEVGDRFTAANFAAEAGNWNVVDYELKELKEVMEVGEITRPKRKKAIKRFLSGPFEKIEDAAKEKDLASFQTTFDETVISCNKCHKSTGKPYIIYEVPSTFSGNLKLAP